MELTEFDVRFCYAPKLGAKVQLFFDIRKKMRIFFPKCSEIFAIWGCR